MATIVVGRELLVTSLRGMIEGAGGDFSAKQLGKWKMVSSVCRRDRGSAGVDFPRRILAGNAESNLALGGHSADRLLGIRLLGGRGSDHA